MIKGQKKLNVTYMARSLEEDGSGWIEGETCMDIQMAEENADLLLMSEEDARWSKQSLKRASVLDGVKIIIDHNERLKNRSYIGGSIKGFELVEDW